MKKVMLVLVGFCFLAGCGATRFCHPTKSEMDFNREKYDCIQTETQFTTNLFGPSATNPLIAIGSGGLNNCLQMKYGWRECP